MPVFNVRTTSSNISYSSPIFLFARSSPNRSALGTLRRYFCFCFPGLNCMHTRAEWRRGGFWIHEEYCVVWVITLWSCRIGSNEPRICTEFTVSPEEKWVDDYSTFIGGRTITYKLNFDERSESPPCWLSWVSLVTISRPSLACCLYSWKHLKMIDLKQLPLA